MIDARQAAKATADQVAMMTSELGKGLEKVISAAIQQGSCKATFYPRNQFETTKAMELLTDYGYQAVVKPAADQRDNDRIEISWG